MNQRHSTLERDDELPMTDAHPEIRTLCKALNGKYQAWLEIRSAGLEAMFVRMHLRGMRQIVVQIEQLASAGQGINSVTPETKAQIDQIKIELAALDRFVAARQQQQSMLDSLTALPEFRLLEIDRALAESVDPESLDKFESDLDADWNPDLFGNAE